MQSRPSRSSRSAGALTDWALGLAGVAFGWSSLVYPFGRDQGLYFYVAREWVLRGQVPYRDVLDHKTPGIYLLYALGVRLFGEQMWPIRLFDLGCIIAMGLLSAALATPRAEKVDGGLRGASVLIASVLYYGYLDYWNTAQSELWYGTLGLGAVWAATRIRAEWRAELVAGIFSGAAVLMKPPAMWFAALAVGLLAWRQLSQRQRAAAPEGPLPRAASVKALLVGGLRFGVGCLVVPVPVLGYFVSKQALGPMVDIVIGANNYYVQHEQGVRSAFEVVARIGEYLLVYVPLSVVLPIVLFRAWRETRSRPESAAWRRELSLSFALVAAGFAAVWMQKKFYLLHWTVILGPITVAIAVLLRRSRAHRAAALGVFFILYAGSAFVTRGAIMWLSANEVAIKWLTGRISRTEFSRVFANGVIRFSFDESERMGNWLREHTTPSDFVAVRGFQPEIYAVAQRRHAGRFFWTTFIVNPQRAYKREAWLAEDMNDLRTHPPKYIVTLKRVDAGPDSRGYYAPLGYGTVGVFGQFHVLSKDEDPANLLLDPSFERADAFFDKVWAAEPSGEPGFADQGRTGKKNLRVELDPGGAWRGARQELLPPAEMKSGCVTAWVRTSNAAITGFIGVRDVNNGVLAETHFAASERWSEVRVCFSRKDAFGVNVFVGGYTAASSAHLDVDDISLQTR